MIGILVVIGFFCSLAVLVIDILLTPWWRSLAGQAVFTLLMMITALIGLSAAHVVFGFYPFRTEISLICFTLLIVSTLTIGFAIIHEQTNGRNRRIKIKQGEKK